MKNYPATLKAKHEISAAAFWRNIPPGELDDRDLRLVRRELQFFDILGESAWILARAGDAGAAIGVAVRLTMKKRASPVVADLAMSAVLLAALAGNAACRDFLAHALERLGARELAASWREANRVAALEASPASEQQPEQTDEERLAAAMGLRA